MSKASDTDVLTPEDLAEIDRLRAAARQRALAAEADVSPEEDAAIIAAAEADPDARPLTDEQLARMRPAHEVHPHLVAAELRRGRGRPKMEAPKEIISIRLDPAVLAHFRAGGAGWRTRINAALLDVLGKPKVTRKAAVDKLVGKPPRRRRAKRITPKRPAPRKSA